MNAFAEILNATHAYAGYCGGCGTMTAVAVDYPAAAKSNARFVAELVRDGYRVQRVTIDETRRELRVCQCIKAKRAAKKPAEPEPAGLDLFAEVTNG